MQLAKSFLLGAALIGAGHGLLAGPASPEGIKIRQPDGSTIQAHIRGDEFQSWIETQDGYTIIQNTKTGGWEYGILDNRSGKLQPSGHAVRPDALPPFSLEKGLRPARDTQNETLQIKSIRQLQQERGNAPKGLTASSSLQMAPISGTRKLIVILVNFSDKTLTTSATNWNSTIFQTGTGVKSVRQFFKDNSFNTLDITPVPHTQGGPSGIVTVSISLAHPNYGNSFVYATETAWLNLALEQAATVVNFAALDTNGDGAISTDEAVFYFIPAGYERSGTTLTPNIWAHAWGGNPGLTAGTKTVPRWAMNGELNGSNAQHPMGVIAHELGHSMAGLPDLYDTASVNEGLGAFSLMASGSWGSAPGEAGGTTPVSLDGWSRENLGWTTPVVPTANGESVPLGTCLSGSGASAKIQNSLLSTQEYFLVENRYPTGWDLGLSRFLGASWPGGLLVMHVDSTLTNNRYVTGSHQMVVAEHANNAAYGSLGTAASLFYTGGSSSSFIPTSTPSSAYYSGMSSAIGLTSATTPGTTMTFTMFGVADTTPPTGKPGTPNGTTLNDTATFTWTAGNAADPETGIVGYRLQVGSTPGGNEVYDRFVGTALTQTVTDLGMWDGLPLYARVSAVNGAFPALGAWSDNSSSVTVNYLASFDRTVLENSNCTFKTLGPWTTTTSTSYANGNSAQSAGIDNDKSTYLQTLVTGPGTLDFYWKVSSELDYDFLTFSINGVDQAEISGTTMTSFAKKTFTIPAGSQLLRWTYAKDGGVFGGLDAGWVDSVSWAPDANTIATVLPASYTTLIGAQKSFTATVTNSQGNTNVNWTINNSGGTFSSAQTASGVATNLTAASTAGTYTITATPVETPNTPGTASLTLVEPASVSVAVTGSAATVLLNAPVTFTAAVTPLTDNSVTWTRSGGTLGLGTSTSTAWSSGTAGTFTITATSAVATGQTGSASVTVVDPTAIELSVNPTTATLVPGVSLPMVGNTNFGTITWTVPAGQGTLITTSGATNTYTPPASASVMNDLTTTVTLTNSSATPPKTTTCAITVKSLDVNRDAAFDLQDLLTLAMDWGTTATRSRLSGGATVRDADLYLLLASF